MAAAPSTRPPRRERRPSASCAFHRLPGARPRPRGALDAVLRRAVQLLGRLRRGRAAEGVPQGHARACNPDIEVHEVLTEAGLRARRRALRLARGRWTTSGRDPLQLAMLQQFLRTASDGWDLALASVRNLFAEADLHADEVGGDFAGEAARLGEALREVHARPRRALPDRARADADAAADARRRDDRPARRRARRRARAGAARRRPARDVRRRRASSAGRAGPAGPRRPAPRPDPAHRSRAGRSSTSRASRPSRSPSGCCPTRRGATSPGCCAPSTTPPRVVERTAAPGRRHRRRAARLPGRGVGRAQPRRLPGGVRRRPASSTADEQHAARRLRRRQGRLRDRLRDPQPPDLGADPAAAIARLARHDAARRRRPCHPVARTVDR